MNAILFIAIVIFLNYLLGYLPKRSIKRKRYRWHAVSIIKQLRFFIDGDKLAFLPDPMFWPLQKHYFTLTFSRYVEDGNKEARKETSKDGKEIKYNQARVLNGIKKPIQTVTEEITRLRKLEIHPYLVEIVLPITGFKFYLVFTSKIEIIEPLKVAKLNEPFVFYGVELHDAIYPWAVEQEKKCADGKDKSKVAQDVIEHFLGLKVDQKGSIKIEIDGKETDLIKYLYKKTGQYGMKTKEFSLDIGFDDEVKMILDARTKQERQDEQTKLEIKISETRDVTRKVEVADRIAEREQDALDLEKVQKPLLTAIGKMRANEYSALPPGVTLFLGGESETDRYVTPLLAKISNNTQKIGGSNESKKESTGEQSKGKDKEGGSVSKK